jgi:hypothetical protein
MHVLWLLFIWMVHVAKPEWLSALRALSDDTARCVDIAQDLWNQAGEACKPSVSQRFALRLVRAKKAILALLLLLLPLKLMLRLLWCLIEDGTGEPLLLEERCVLL